MRRLASVTAALVAVASLIVIGSSVASAHVSSHVAGSVTHGVAPRLELTDTLYYYDFAESRDSFCEVDTLIPTNKKQTAGEFRSDKGDIGTWNHTSNEFMFKFTGASGAFPAGSVLVFKQGAASAKDIGVDTNAGIQFAPFYLEGGDDILGLGIC
jgi:hypothetical protein